MAPTEAPVEVKLDRKKIDEFKVVKEPKKKSASVTSIAVYATKRMLPCSRVLMISRASPIAGADHTPASPAT